jgi:DNA replication protein DnaC
MSVRTARRVAHATALPSQKPERDWRTRTNPFADVWDGEIVPLLRSTPKLKAITLLQKLQRDHVDRFPDSMRRTLERHIRQWRALEGPSKEVFFPQTYEPGVRGLSDFTHMDQLGVTIAGVAFSHMLYHFVLAYSRWEYASVVDGGESFQALATGLQNALWQAGGCPLEHRSDSLSAAFKNRKEEEDFTVRYKALLEHYGMAGTRTALASGDAWLEKGATVLIFGPPGAGKSHLGSAIGHALIDAGYRVLCMRTSELVQKLQAARKSLQLPSALAKLDRFDLIILDDLSYVRKDQAETSVLFELIAERYERRSLLITANQPFSGWNNVFPDPGMTVAAIDRLVHHSTIFELNVESYRRRKASDNNKERQRQLPTDHQNGATTIAD